MKISRFVLCANNNFMTLRTSYKSIQKSNQTEFFLEHSSVRGILFVQRCAINCAKMEIFQYEKSMMDRLEEAQNVLSSNKVIPASRVVEEWSYNVELLIEPAGWQAIWKISRVICEELKIQYPTTVYGTVTNVLFKELKAVFSIIAIQDDDIHLPEEHEVPLIDLWPTKVQENSAINIDATANCIDMVRFFFKNLWMPWDADNDEDVDWATKFLESRMRFCYDLKADMSPPLASYIRALLVEAEYIQRRREYLELDISDDEDMTDNKPEITDLMSLHVRLATIKHEIKMWENPKLRKVFEPLKFPPRQPGGISVVMEGAAVLPKHMQDLQKAHEFIGDEKTIELSSSLQECLMHCGTAGHIYLAGGRHSIKFLENLNNSIVGLVPCDNSIDLRLNENVDESKQPVIAAKEFENILLTMGGDVRISNVILDCRKVRTGILIRDGSVLFENCTFIGDKKSTTATAITMFETAKVSCDNCVIRDFATGIAIRGSSHSETTSGPSSLILTNSIIANSGTGIDCNEGSCITMKGSRIIKATHYGVIASCSKMSTNKLLLSGVHEAKQHSIPIDGECQFIDCTPNNIVVFNKNDMCLLKNVASVTEVIGDINVVDCSSEMEDCDQANNINTSSEQDSSIIVVDD